MKQVLKAKPLFSRLSLKQILKYKRSLSAHEQSLKDLRKIIEQYCYKIQVFKDFDKLKI